MSQDITLKSLRYDLRMAREQLRHQLDWARFYMRTGNFYDASCAMDYCANHQKDINTLVARIDDRKRAVRVKGWDRIAA
jgi:hypothetical protein